jgi:preprotein translocase subunit SecD
LAGEPDVRIAGRQIAAFAAVCALLGGCQTPPPPATATLEFRLIVDCTPLSQPYALQGSEKKLCLSPDVVVSAADVDKSITVSIDRDSMVGIRLALGSAGAARMAAATAAHIGERMGVVLNGTLILAPIIREKMSDAVEIAPVQNDDDLKAILAAILVGSVKR